MLCSKFCSWHLLKLRVPRPRRASALLAPSVERLLLPLQLPPRLALLPPRPPAQERSHLKSTSASSTSGEIGNVGLTAGPAVQNSKVVSLAHLPCPLRTHRFSLQLCHTGGHAKFLFFESATDNEAFFTPAADALNTFRTPLIDPMTLRVTKSLTC